MYSNLNCKRKLKHRSCGECEFYVKMNPLERETRNTVTSISISIANCDVRHADLRYLHQKSYYIITIIQKRWETLLLFELETEMHKHKAHANPECRMLQLHVAWAPDNQVDVKFRSYILQKEKPRMNCQTAACNSTVWTQLLFSNNTHRLWEL